MSDLLTLIIPGYFQDYLCTILMCFANSVFTLGKGRVKKEIVEFSTKGWGWAAPDFPLRKNKTKKNMVLKYWIWPIDYFKTHLFFSIFWVGGPFLAWN